MSQKASLERTFTQAEFDAFARLSGDDNPIHVDPQFAARTRFGKTVAHGALLCSVLRGLVEQLAPGGRQISQSTMYPAASAVDQALRFEVETIDKTGDITTLKLQITRISDGEITCTGQTAVAS